MPSILPLPLCSMAWWIFAMYQPWTEHIISTDWACVCGQCVVCYFFMFDGSHINLFHHSVALVLSVSLALTTVIAMYGVCLQTFCLLCIHRLEVYTHIVLYATQHICLFTSGFYVSFASFVFHTSRHSFRRCCQSLIHFLLFSFSFVYFFFLSYSPIDN